jgi:hypothetical protein
MTRNKGYPRRSGYPRASRLPELGEELFLFMAALKQMKPGENGAHVFAKTLSGATPDSFAKALQRILGWLGLFYREMGLSADDARRECDKFESATASEYARLRAASGAANHQGG